MTAFSMAQSAWQQLRRHRIDCPTALSLLVDDTGIVNQTLLDPEVADRFFREFSNKQKLPPVLPLLLWRNCFYLGTPVTLSPDEIAQLRRHTLGEIKVIPIAQKSYTTWHYSRNYDPNKIRSTPLSNPITGFTTTEDLTETTEQFLDLAVDQIGRIKTLLSSALRNRVSDIHLEPTANDSLRVRYRIDGILREITTFPPTIARRVVVALKVMAKMDISESRRPQDGRIGEQYMTEQDSSKLDLRVSTLPCVNGAIENREKVVIRLLPQDNPFSTLKDLGLSPTALSLYRTWLDQPQGIIILTGPTGSGKTSTLYTSLQAIARESVNVVTVENPVEYVLPGITQTQINDKAGMTFASGLRSILRQDPDIIMIGEIRDHETAETAIRAALTGHLVFTTLHTNDAIGAIPRLKDLGLDPGLVSDALLGIAAQRLVRRVCPHCAEPYTPSLQELNSLGLKPGQVSLEHCRKGKGCHVCFGSGYAGREAIVELLDVDETVQTLIYSGDLTQLKAYLYNNGFISFRESALEKVLTGLTTIAEVTRVLHRNALRSRSTPAPVLNLAS